MSDNDFLANIQQEGTPFNAEPNEQVTETPADPPAENQPTESTPPTEGVNSIQPQAKEIPFHKNPRWQQMRQENEHLKATVEELARWKQEADLKISQGFQGQQNPVGGQIPTWFSKFFGDNAELYQLFNKEFVGDLRQSVMNEMKQEQARIQQAQQAETQRWDKWVEDSIAKVQDQFDVTLQDGERNAFLKFVTTYLPTDPQGNVDLIKGWELFNQLKQNEGKERMEAKKALASKVTSDPKGESKKQDYQTPTSLRNKSWLDIAGGKV